MPMTEEQEKTIKRCEELIKPEHANWIGISNQIAIETVLNMLKEKDKEIAKKDKIIDLMADCLYKDDTSFGYGKLKNVNTPNEIKQYFEQKSDK